MIQDPLAVLLVLAVIVWASIRIEQRVPGGRYLGSVLTAILMATVVANVGVLPSRSAAYDWLGGIGIEIAIALVLLGVDIGTVRRAGPGMLGAFGLGAVGTAAGAVVGGMVLAGTVGPETWKLAGQYTGTYTGGSVNFVAVGQAVGTSPGLYSAAIAADNVTTTIWMAACLVAPLVLARLWPRLEARRAAVADGPEADHGLAFNETGRRVSLHDVTVIATLILGAVWLSHRLGDLMPGIPSVLWLTTLTLAMAQLPFVRGLVGAPLWGNYLMHLFLATIGAQSIIAEIMRVGPAVFYFTLIVVAVHGVIVFGAGRLLRLDLPTLAVASQANVGGPASAMALAAARDYPDKILPGVAVGLLGYALGTYTGLGVANLMNGLLVR